jgi:hypothetical protein
VKYEREGTMWLDRYKQYNRPILKSGIFFICFGTAIGWYLDLNDEAFMLCLAASIYMGMTVGWMDTATDGLWRIEEKLDDLVSKLDEIEATLDKSDDRPPELDY